MIPAATRMPWLFCVPHYVPRTTFPGQNRQKALRTTCPAQRTVADPSDKTVTSSADCTVLYFLFVMKLAAGKYQYCGKLKNHKLEGLEASKGNKKHKR